MGSSIGRRRSVNWVRVTGRTGARRRCPRGWPRALAGRTALVDVGVWGPGRAANLARARVPL
eukprot:4432229-Pyramimonas_sp.AAC.1